MSLLDIDKMVRENFIQKAKHKENEESLIQKTKDIALERIRDKFYEETQIWLKITDDGKLWIKDMVWIEDNTKLTEIPSNLTIESGGLHIENCPKFTSIGDHVTVGLKEEGNVTIVNCPSFSHIGKNFHIGESFTIRKCNSITELPIDLDIDGSYIYFDDSLQEFFDKIGAYIPIPKFCRTRYWWDWQKANGHLSENFIQKAKYKEGQDNIIDRTKNIYTTKNFLEDLFDGLKDLPSKKYSKYKLDEDDLNELKESIDDFVADDCKGTFYWYFLPYQYGRSVSPKIDIEISNDRFCMALYDYTLDLDERQRSEHKKFDNVGHQLLDRTIPTFPTNPLYAKKAIEIFKYCIQDWENFYENQAIEISGFAIFANERGNIGKYYSEELIYICCEYSTDEEDEEEELYDHRIYKFKDDLQENFIQKAKHKEEQNSTSLEPSGEFLNVYTKYAAWGLYMYKTFKEDYGYDNNTLIQFFCNVCLNPNIRGPFGIHFRPIILTSDSLDNQKQFTSTLEKFKKWLKIWLKMGINAANHTKEMKDLIDKMEEVSPIMKDKGKLFIYFASSYYGSDEYPFEPDKFTFIVEKEDKDEFQTLCKFAKVVIDATLAKKYYNLEEIEKSVDDYYKIIEKDIKGQLFNK